MSGPGDERSCACFAGNDITEGRLCLAEVQSLSLSASRLVVMSACKTFTGALSRDGILGLSRAFLAAGARTLVASLWPLGDNDTVLLIERFYSALCEPMENGERRSAAAALQKAVIGMVNEGHGVHVWAPFVVYGADDVS